MAPKEQLGYSRVPEKSIVPFQYFSIHIFFGSYRRKISSGAVQIFKDASNKGWDAHLGDYTVKEASSISESKLHITFLVLKVVLLALKKFKPLCKGQREKCKVATDNIRVLA